MSSTFFQSAHSRRMLTQRSTRSLSWHAPSAFHGHGDADKLRLLPPMGRAARTKDER